MVVAKQAPVLERGTAGTGAHWLGGSAVRVPEAGPCRGRETGEGGRGIGSAGERNFMMYAPGMCGKKNWFWSILTRRN